MMRYVKNLILRKSIETAKLVGNVIFRDLNNNTISGVEYEMFISVHYRHLTQFY